MSREPAPLFLAPDAHEHATWDLDTDPDLYVAFSAGRRGAGSVDCRWCGVEVCSLEPEGDPAVVATRWRHAPTSEATSRDRDRVAACEAAHPTVEVGREIGPVFGPFSSVQLTYQWLRVGGGEHLACYRHDRGDWVLTDIAGVYAGEAYSDAVVFTGVLRPEPLTVDGAPAATTERFVAEFTAQAWIGDHALDVDPQGHTRWDVTQAFHDLPDGYRDALLFDIAQHGSALDVDDLLRGDPAAPAWVRDWSGPFSIYVTRMVDDNVGRRLIRGRVRIDWDDLGEGWSGEFDPDDPLDSRLLRFTVFRFEGDDVLLAAAGADPALDARLAVEGRGWVPVDAASYCTLVTADTDLAERHRLLGVLMDAFHDPVTAEESVKQLAARLSWIAPAPAPGDVDPDADASEPD